MGTQKTTKINQLLSAYPYGIVFQSAWLTRLGYDSNLQKRYRNSGWLESIGNGAMVRSGDEVGYEGAIYALQNQASSKVHPGGKTALSLLGKAHYLEFSPKKVILFGNDDDMIPTWLKKHNWGIDIEYHPTSFLQGNSGLTTINVKNIYIQISAAARAIMECLYLAPAHQDLLECYQLMEGLNNLIPGQVQELLENCHSVKVKRLFLYMAEKTGHDWFRYINLAKVDLGDGKRSLVKKGVYIARYKITVPKELDEYGKTGI
ncbi:MAG: type IV toxin-antitoxin system AbiEi family antitoxin [Taibaiella sp.]|nr:type IV toxin-antitoxin system AbiEi family antitoxin [Taibaiella sp.]